MYEVNLKERDLKWNPEALTINSTLGIGRGGGIKFLIVIHIGVAGLLKIWNHNNIFLE